MSMFSTGRRTDNGLPGDAGSPGHLSILAPGLRIVGELEADGVIKVEGRLEGGIRSTSQVIVAPGGAVTGDLSAPDIIVSGRVEGDVTATARIEVQAGGAVLGNLTSPRIVVQEGGEVNGRFRMPERQPAVVTGGAGLKKTA